MSSRPAAVLFLTYDCNTSLTQRALKKVVLDAESWLSTESATPPVVLVLQVEGLTADVCNSGALGMNAIPRWKPAQDVVDAVKLPESHVFVPPNEPTQFTRVLHPFAGTQRDRRADRCVQRDGIHEFIYDGETVKHNLIMTLEFAIHYSDYEILYVFGHGKMHTLNRLVRDLRQTAQVPVALSPYLMLPSMQNFISMNSRILILTWSKSVFEDNYDAILPPAMNVQRKRIKVVGIDDVLRNAGLPHNAEEAANADAAQSAVVAACKDLVYRYENSDLQIRAVLCPDHTVLYQDSLIQGLQGSGVLVYSLRNMLELQIRGLQARTYSWELSDHMQLASSVLPQIDEVPPEQTPVTTRSPFSNSMALMRSYSQYTAEASEESPALSKLSRRGSRFGSLNSELCVEIQNEAKLVKRSVSFLFQDDAQQLYAEQPCLSLSGSGSLSNDVMATPMQAFSRCAASFLSLPPDEKTMGILQVDGAGYWNKLPIRGDAADANTFMYQVCHMRPEGFSFACCQAGPRGKDGSSDWQFAEGRIFVPAGSSPEAHLYKQSSDIAGQPRTADRVIEDSTGTTYVYSGTTIKRNFVRAVDLLVGQGVVGIGSDCGFMISMNDLVREIPSVVEAGVPVALSSLALLPLIRYTLSDDARILVLTANSESFDDYYDKLVPAHFQVARSNLIIIGCQGVDGFGAEVAEARTVDAETAATNIVQLVQSAMDDYEMRGRPIRAVVFECAELPGYTDYLQKQLSLKLPIYDAISLIDFLRSGVALPS